MKQHGKHHRVRSPPNMNRKPNVEQQHLGPSSAWGPQFHPTRNTPDMKRHLWADFQLQRPSRLRAPDVTARCSNHVDSCEVWFHGRFVVLCIVNISRQRWSPDCLPASFDSQLPPKCSPETVSKVLTHTKSQMAPDVSQEGAVARVTVGISEMKKMSRSNV